MSSDSDGTVLLLHGAWMNRWVMSYLGHALRAEGFPSQALTYRTMRDPMETHLSRLARRIVSLDAERIHLVGHSLGGVVILKYLQRTWDRRIGRVVLLGAPVNGCRAAADLARYPGGELLMGKSATVWRQPLDVAIDARIEIGAIAGTGGFGLGRFVVRLPKPNDGVVCVDETKFSALRDHLVLPVGHSVMLISPRIARQTAAFLRTGGFLR